MSEEVVSDTAVSKDQPNDQPTVTGVKTYTQRQAKLVEMAGGTIPDGSIIEPDEPTPVPEPEIQPEVEAEDGVVGEPTVAEPIQGESGDDLKGDVSEKTIPVSDDSITIGEGDDALSIVKKDGKHYVKVVVDGEEELFDLNTSKKYIGLFRSTEKQKQLLAEEKKAIEAEKARLKEQEDLDSIFARVLPQSNPQPQAEPEDDYGVFGIDKEDRPIPVGGVSPKLKQALESIDALKKQNAEFQNYITGMEKQNEIAAKVAVSYATTRNYLNENFKMNLPEEPDKRIQTRVEVYAANNDLTPQEVATTPAYLTDALRSLNAKKQTPSVEGDSTSEPPPVEEPRKTTVKTGKLQALKKEYEDLKKQQMKKGTDEKAIAGRMLSIRKQMKELEKSKGV